MHVFCLNRFLGRADEHVCLPQEYFWKKSECSVFNSNYSIKIATVNLCDGEMDAYDENKDSRTVYRHSKCNWFQNQKLWMTCSIWSVDIFKNFLQHNALLQKTLPKELDRAGTFLQKEMKEKKSIGRMSPIIPCNIHVLQEFHHCVFMSTCKI